MKTKIFPALIFILSCAWIFVPESFAMQEASATSSQPTIVTSEGNTYVTPAPSAVIATDGLSQKEKKELEKGYQYNVRNKSALLSPYFAAIVSFILKSAWILHSGTNI